MPPILLPTVVGCFGPRPPARRRLVALPGIEPGCPGGRWILSPLRLPVPPEGPSSRRAVCSMDCYPACERDRGEIEQLRSAPETQARPVRARNRFRRGKSPRNVRHGACCVGGTTLSVIRRAET